MYKILNEIAPDYLQRLFTQRHVNDYNLRNLEGKLSLPQNQWGQGKTNFKMKNVRPKRRFKSYFFKREGGLDTPGPSQHLTLGKCTYRALNIHAARP